MWYEKYKCILSFIIWKVAWQFSYDMSQKDLLPNSNIDNYHFLHILILLVYSYELSLCLQQPHRTVIFLWIRRRFVKIAWVCHINKRSQNFSGLRKAKVYFLLRKFLLWPRWLISFCSWAHSGIKPSGIFVVLLSQQGTFTLENPAQSSHWNSHLLPLCFTLEMICLFSL